MYVIDAIKFLTKKIDKNLKGHLGQSKQVDMELATRIQSTAQEGATQAPHVAILPRGENIPPAEQLAAVSVEPVEIQFWPLLSWYDLQQAGSPWITLSLPEAKDIDKIRLRHGQTWGEFMLASNQQFEIWMKDIYKNDLTLKKMLVMARFKRQLLLLCLYGQTLLQQNELAMSVKQAGVAGVDEWLVKTIADIAQETLELLLAARTSSESCYKGFGMTISVSPNESTSETLVATIPLMLKAFQSFCKDQNKRRGKNVGEGGSMVDVLPNQQPNQLKREKFDPMVIINRMIAAYYAKNLFEDKLTEVQQVKGTGISVARLWESLAYLTHNSTTSDNKRKHIESALSEFDQVISGENVAEHKFWLSLFNKLHTQHDAGVTVGQSCLSYLPYVNSKKHNIAKAYDKIHDELRRHPSIPETIAEQHQGCVKPDRDSWAVPKV